MQGAMRRIEREAEMSNRQAYNIAAMILPALGGKVPPFEQVFRRKPAAATKVQSAEVQEANLRALAKIWGAVH